MNKNVLIIGNAGYMLDHKIGPIIDDFKGDIVRFNMYLIAGFESFVGTRCDYWFTDDISRKIRKHIVENIVFTGNRLNKHTKDLIEQLGTGASWVGNEVVENCKKQIGYHGPTSGVMAISYFLQKGYNVFIHGFDFFMNDDIIHYYQNLSKQETKKLLKEIRHYHSGEHEKKWVDGLAAGGAIEWFIKEGGENAL